MEWMLLNDSYPPEQLSILSYMLNENDSRPAKQQLNDGYAQYGGWRPIQGFTLFRDKRLKYPGDPAISPWAFTALRNESIFVYPGDWVLILQLDGSFEVARMD